jgi:hypothetical protein
MSTTFWQDQIAQTETMIQGYIDAINFLIANPTESYSLDTGQTQQEVKRHNINNLQTQLDSLYNRYSALCLRVNTSPTITIPAW